MMIFNLYTAYQFDSTDSAVNLIKDILKIDIPVFVSYGTSETVNKKIDEKKIEIPAKILSDYPLHAFGEIYLRTRDKKMALKISHQAGSINRWVLFVADKKFEHSKTAETLFPLFNLLADKYGVFFIGGDDENEINRMHLIEETAEYGNKRTIKVGMDNIKKLPGIYWITFLHKAFWDKSFPKKIDFVFREIKTPEGIFIVVTENCSETEKKQELERRIIESISPNLIFNKESAGENNWLLEAVIDKGRVTDYTQVNLPWFDIYKLSDKDRKKMQTIGQKDIDDLPAKIKGDGSIKKLIHETGSVNSLDEFSKIEKLLKRLQKSNDRFLPEIVLFIGKKLGDIINEKYGYSWGWKKPVYKSYIEIPKLAPKKFSPFYLVLHLALNGMNWEDFYEELKFYLQ